MFDSLFKAAVDGYFHFVAELGEQIRLSLLTYSPFSRY